VWGRPDINPRGRTLLEYLVSSDLEILNQGEEPTFLTERRHEIIDLTLCFGELVSEIHGDSYQIISTFSITLWKSKRRSELQESADHLLGLLSGGTAV
jgi:hypothetical protein